MSKIEIFWDDQDPDPKAQGWEMRVTQSNGHEDSMAIDGDKDESIAILSQSAAPYVDEDTDPSTLSWDPMREGVGWTAKIPD